MAHIDALIDKVTDPALRQMLRDQVSMMLSKQSFGLVYQQHKPETVELWHYKVRRGCKVRMIAENDGQLYEVKTVGGGKATIEALNEAADRSEVNLDEIVVIREFGEAIYPGLRSVGRVEQGAEGQPAHLVINAEISTRSRRFSTRTKTRLTASTSIRRTTRALATGSTTTTTWTALISSVTASGLPLWNGV